MAKPANVAADADGRRAIPMDVTVTLSALIFPEPTGGYSAEVPALPGCFTEGDTLEELQARLREAAEGWLMAKRDMLAARASGSP